MNCLLAKVKTGTRTATFRKILSGAEIYTILKLPTRPISEIRTTKGKNRKKNQST